MLQSILSEYKPYSDIIPVIAQFIKKNKNFFISTHVDSDADGIGAQIGFFYLAMMLEKNVQIYNHEDLSDYLSFMIPDDFRNHFSRPSTREEDYKRFESVKHDSTFLILDNSELKRTGYLGEFLLDEKIDWFSIDHHDITGTDNIMVDPDYASTCEIIWDLFMYFEFPIPEKAAYALYAGMVSDTGNFRYPKTSFRTHLAAGYLIESGLDPNEIYRHLFENFSIARLALISSLSDKAIIDKKKGFIITEITRDLRESLAILPDLTEGLVNFFLGFHDVRISILIKETDEGELKASLRSIKEINISEFARRFKGGGHKNAAGLKISRPYNDAKAALLSEFEKFILEQK